MNLRWSPGEGDGEHISVEDYEIPFISFGQLTVPVGGARGVSKAFPAVAPQRHRRCLRGQPRRRTAFLAGSRYADVCAVVVSGLSRIRRSGLLGFRDLLNCRYDQPQ